MVRIGDSLQSNLRKVFAESIFVFTVAWKKSLSASDLEVIIVAVCG